MIKVSSPFCPLFHEDLDRFLHGRGRFDPSHHFSESFLLKMTGNTTIDLVKKL
jgi:hypothetical protein